MKRFLKITAAISALALAAVAFSACGSESSSKALSSGESDESVSTSVQSTDADLEVDPEEVDYSKPDLVINDGDFKAMETFLGEWETKKWDGKVIKVTGINARRMSNCTVREKNSEGVGRGFSWEMINGVFPDDYPEDDAKVTLTGVLVYNDSTWSRKLMVPRAYAVTEK